MRAVFWIGLVVLVLGVLSLIVPVPHREKEGIAIGGLSIGVETRHEERVPIAISAIMILGGLGCTVAARGKTS